MSDEEARENLRNNLEFWANLDNTSVKNNFIQSYNRSSRSFLITVEEFERTYQNSKNLAFEFLENFDNFFALIDVPNSFMRHVDNNTIILKEDFIKITYTGNSNFYVSAMFNHLINFNNHLLESMGQFRSESSKLR